MGQPRNRLTMFLIALLIAVAAAQNNYTIITLYSDTTCTATARTAVYSFNTTAACTAKGCTNGYSISCSTTTPTPYLCRTCYQNGGTLYAATTPFFAFCGASFLQVSVAVIGLVVAFVAAL